MNPTHGSLPVPDFRSIVEKLCQSAADDFVAARTRLERLRRDGVPAEHDEGR